MVGKGGSYTQNNSPARDESKPFDSSSPRFNYGKQEIKMALKSPGPAAYQKSYEEIELKNRIEI